MGQYLCRDCCSHKIVRSAGSTPGCVNVIEITMNHFEEEIVVPPKDNSKHWLDMHSFICSCKKKALICQNSKFDDFKYSKDHERHDEKLFKTEKKVVKSSIIWCNVRVL